MTTRLLLNVELNRAAGGEPRPTLRLTWNSPAPSTRVQKAELYRLAADIEERSDGKGNWITHVGEPTPAPGGRAEGTIEIELITGVHLNSEEELEASLAAQAAVMAILCDLADKLRRGR